MSENPSWEECKKATPCREFKIAASGALWRFFPPSGQQNIHKLKTIKKEPKQISQICPKTKDRVLARKHAPGARKNMVMARKDRDLSIQKAPKTCKRRTKKGRKTTQKKKKNTQMVCANPSRDQAGRFQGRLVCDFCKHSPETRCGITCLVRQVQVIVVIMFTKKSEGGTACSIGTMRSCASHQESWSNFRKYPKLLRVDSYKP